MAAQSAGEAMRGEAVRESAASLDGHGSDGRGTRLFPSHRRDPAPDGAAAPLDTDAVGRHRGDSTMTPVRFDDRARTLTHSLLTDAARVPSRLPRERDTSAPWKSIAVFAATVLVISGAVAVASIALQSAPVVKPIPASPAGQWKSFQLPTREAASPPSRALVRTTASRWTTEGIGSSPAIRAAGHKPGSSYCGSRRRRAHSATQATQWMPPT